MMRIISLIFVVACGLLCGCHKTIMELPSDLRGLYKGTYAVTNNYGTDKATTFEGPVTFAFGRDFTIAYLRTLGHKEPIGEDIDYLCIGEKPLLPPQGGGKYSILDGWIILTDTANRTADMDWLPIILTGYFEHSFDGKNLTMTQNNRTYGRFHKIVLVKEKFGETS